MLLVTVRTSVRTLFISAFPCVSSIHPDHTNSSAPGELGLAPVPPASRSRPAWAKDLTPRHTLTNNITLIEFYENYKDPSWPECKSYTHIHLLPQYVQEEIKSVYKPAVNVVKQSNFVELLQKSYSDQLKYCKETCDVPLNGSIIYDLGEYYFKQNFDKLKEVAELLEWSWDKTLSDNFYSWVLIQNKRYLIWLDQMKEQCYNNTNKFTLDWEIAYLNAIREHIGEYSG